MKIQAAQLAAHLSKGLAPVYVLSGDEPLQLLEAADAIRLAAKEAGYITRVVMEVGSGFKWGELALEADSMSLFGDKKVIDLRIPDGKPGAEGSAALCQYAERLPPDTLLLVSMPKLDSKQTASKWYSALDQAGISLQIWPPNTAQLPGWIKARMQQAGLMPGTEVAELLAEQVEGNLLAAKGEIEKLLLLYGPGPINLDQLREMIADSARFDVFALVDAALEGNSQRCLRILGGLREEGLAEPILVWALARELRQMHQIALAARNSGLEHAISQARVWSNRAPLVKKALGRIRSNQTWLCLLALCQKADAASKGASADDPWVLCEQLCLALCKPELAPCG